MTYNVARIWIWYRIYSINAAAQVQIKNGYIKYSLVYNNQGIYQQLCLQNHSNVISGMQADMHSESEVSIVYLRYIYCIQRQ